jgi:hypothetical protein
MTDQHPITPPPDLVRYSQTPNETHGIIGKLDA